MIYSMESALLLFGTPRTSSSRCSAAHECSVHVVPSADGSCRRCDLIYPRDPFQPVSNGSVLWNRRKIKGGADCFEENPKVWKRTRRPAASRPTGRLCCSISSGLGFHVTLLTRVVAEAESKGRTSRFGAWTNRNRVVLEPLWKRRSRTRGTGDAQLLLKIPPWKPPSPPRPLRPPPVPSVPSFSLCSSPSAVLPSPNTCPVFGCLASPRGGRRRSTTFLLALMLALWVPPLGSVGGGGAGYSVSHGLAAGSFIIPGCRPT